jgi:hypothetical protein
MKVIGVPSHNDNNTQGLFSPMDVEMKGTHSFAKLCVHHEVVDMLLSLGQL